MHSYLKHFRCMRIAASAALLLVLAVAASAQAQSIAPAAASTSQTIAPIGLAKPAAAPAGNVYDESDALSSALTEELLVIAALLAAAGIGFLRPWPLSSVMRRVTASERRRLAYARLVERRSALAHKLALAKKEAPATRKHTRHEDIVSPHSRVRPIISRAITN
ncbi:MAG: hypothetical protein ACREGH_03435 [Minisyncoccia bacterium]